MIFNEPTAGQEPKVAARVIGTKFGRALEVEVWTAERTMSMRFLAHRVEKHVEKVAAVVCDAWEMTR